jgi:DtxR family Mn-dependent transcriptional regulator
MPKDSTTKVTSALELAVTSESEQMYLITVARAVEDGREGPVPIAAIATALGVSVPAANEMVRKLDSRGLVAYEPYHGVQLNEAGRIIADQLLRTRRLWATFLVDHLGFSPSVADEQACELEHATTPEAADRLAAYLGNPVSGPLGHPIPTSSVAADPRGGTRLTDATVGTGLEVIAVTATKQVAEFLTAEGIAPGSRVVLTGSGSSGLLVEIDDRVVHLTESVADAIDVEPVAAARKKRGLHGAA